MHLRSLLKLPRAEKSKRYPRQWIRYADTEGDRLQKLRDVGATVPSCSKVDSLEIKALKEIKKSPVLLKSPGLFFICRLFRQML